MTDPFMGNHTDDAILAGMGELSNRVGAHTKAIEGLTTSQKRDRSVTKYLHGLTWVHIGVTLTFALVAIITGVIINGVISDLRGSVLEQCNTLDLLLSTYRGAPSPGSPISSTKYHDVYIRLQHSADHLNCGLKHVVPGT